MEDKALWPVTVIASDICEDLGDSTERYHGRLIKYLIQGHRELNLYVLQELDVKTCILNTDGTVTLPCDFVYETKVGLMQNGVIAVMDLDKSIIKSKAKYTDTQIQNDCNGIWDGSCLPDVLYSFNNCFHNGGYLGEMYGYGNGYHTNGWYNIDKREGVIKFGSLIPPGAEIVVEYKSSGLADGFKLVPIEIVAALKFYAKAEFYADTNIGLHQMNMERYREQYYRIKRLYNHRNPDYLAWLFKSSQRPAVH